MSEPNRKYLLLPGDYGALNPRSHSRVMWHLRLEISIDQDVHAFYRGADFADAADAFATFYECESEAVWGRLVTEPCLTPLLKQIDDLIEAEDAHISESTL